jgi:hypothetical protein
MVDTEPPSFSDPTAITNPLFPAATVTQLVHLGVDGGQPLRVEVTLMPDTRAIEWNGQTVDAVVVQFAAYRERRILEVAYDYFAQADDGSVWYFGELVDNYSDGRIANHSGAWLAGEDGPPGMIMPADPEVGDIFHPENIPGVVFEELIVLETDVRIAGPSGEISGAIRVEEHLMEGTVEQKVFAPGYGEFQADAPNEFVTVAVASPTDAAAGAEPQAVADILDGSRTALAAANAEDWQRVTAAAVELAAAWENVAQTSAGEIPGLLADELSRALGVVHSASDTRDGLAAQQAAIDVMQAALDVRLRYQPPSTVDLWRMQVWTHQLLLDAARSEGTLSDMAILTTIWDRLHHAISTADAEDISQALAATHEVAEGGNAEAVMDRGRALLALLEGLRSTASGRRETFSE